MSNDCQTFNADYIEIRKDYFDSEEMSLTNNDMEHYFLCQTPKTFLLSTPWRHIQESRAPFIHEVEWLTSRPGRFTPYRKPRYPFSRILGVGQRILEL